MDNRYRHFKDTEHAVSDYRRRNNFQWRALTAICTPGIGVCTAGIGIAFWKAWDVAVVPQPGDLSKVLTISARYWARTDMVGNWSFGVNSQNQRDNTPLA